MKFSSAFSGVLEPIYLEVFDFHSVF